jgi:hypothetical protein
VAGAIVAAAVLYLIASGKPAWEPGGFASNGFGDLSPGKYSLLSCFIAEVLATFFFLYVIIGTTSKGAAVGFAGIPIGLCLTLIHLFLIPITNASVNPARSTCPALFAGGPYSRSSGCSGWRPSSAQRWPAWSRAGSTKPTTVKSATSRLREDGAPPARGARLPFAVCRHELCCVAAQIRGLLKPIDRARCGASGRPCELVA